MSTTITNKLVVAISSRALFDLTESNHIFETEGVNKYAQYQISRENEILSPGPAFPLVEKLLHLNSERNLVEIILLSRNSADSGLRIFNSIQHYGLNITRAAFSAGKSPYQYIRAFQAHLFLSTHPADVRHALKSGCAAATILSQKNHSHENAHSELRIAFDGDAVIFSDESEQIYQREGLEAFTKHEQQHADQPMNGGPFKGFLSALHQLLQHFPENNCPIRTALVTARQAPAHKRVIHTLRSWNIRIDEALFLGGLDKGIFLNAFNADIFFDDQPMHCHSASEHVTTGHVPTGIVNDEN
ncbi:MAG: 5'-nucleotidase [Coxiella sp. RIFCSPHIGHO2_12_FULL_42_15]|nr:MAG: 5'-nucleotidase [Coxiella sp. RIFCSPHIGHO2_12_FULL_42_15]